MPPSKTKVQISGVIFDGGPGRNVFEPWEFLKFIVNFKDVSLRSNGFYQL